MVHRILDIASDFIGYRAHPRRNHKAESAHEPLIVEHYENHVEKYDEPAHYGKEYVETAVNQRHCTVHELVDVLLHEFLGKHLEIDVAAQHLVELWRQVFYGDVGCGVVAEHLGHLVHFVDYRRYEEIEEQSE